LNSEDQKTRLMALYREFYDESRALREKYARNQALYLDQALGRRSAGDRPRTGTPVLYATYRQELADAVEMMPEAVFLARRRQDEARAERMTALYRAVMERMGFEQTYIRICEYRARLGVGYCETMMVEGEPQVVAYDPRAVLTDPATEDLQEGRAVFKVSYHTMDYYRAHYPMKARRMKPESPPLDAPDAKRVALMTAYYKTWEDGKSAVHQMKIAGGCVLYDSRTDRPGGLYAHGEYPFVAWYYDRLPGTPWGFGAFDYLAPVQNYIDKLDTLVMQNIARGAKPRLMVNRSAGLDLEAFLDEDKEIVLADRIDESAIRWQESAPLAPYAVQMLGTKCEMLKAESGQNAASRGELPSNSTSGAAISMLQAAGSKRTNLHQATINQAFLTMARQVVSNLSAYGSRDASYRTADGYAVLGKEDALGKWEYDLQVRLQRMPKYESVYQNQLLMQLLQMGAMPAKTAFRLMDLSNKEAILKAIEETEGETQNGTGRGVAGDQAGEHGGA
jgi:hypothetical protein